ncbi:MAG: ferredoxin [Thalassobaculum sp.]|uniref:ferredoxin n=1 Tax=Thalassobaculum sp. TaxID=2022740 RepID=UPI0032EB059A
MTPAHEPGPWWEALRGAVEAHGFRLNGGFHDDDGGTIVVIGHAGPRLWDRFSAETPAGPDPLDRWTRATLAPVADRFGGSLILPNDGPPFRPFQRWAMRAEAVHPSPLGLLVHPEFGLWHALRAALLFPDRREVPPRADAPSPCATCAGKPCLTACPVGAFDGKSYAADRCAAHVASEAGRDCRARGCLARHACPVGSEWAWGDAQQAFHMAAFLAGRG